MKTLITSLLLILLGTAGTYACPAEKLESISTDDLKVLREVLKDAEADPFDQMAAYDRMACSDNAQARMVAAETAMESASADLREYVMFDVLMGMSTIEVIVDPSGDEVASQLEGGSTLRLNNSKADRDQGCIILDDSVSMPCEDVYAKLTIDGDRVQFRAGSFTGTLRLAEGKMLTGKVNYVGQSSSSAYVELF